MILVGSTDDDRHLVLHLGDDATGQILYAAKLSHDRAESLITQMQVILKSLDTSPIKVDEEVSPNPQA
jgi:hypothetical protein